MSVSFSQKHPLRCYRKEPYILHANASKGKWTLEIIINIIQVPPKDIQGPALQEYSLPWLLLLDCVAWRILDTAMKGQEIDYNLISEGHHFRKIISFMCLAPT